MTMTGRSRTHEVKCWPEFFRDVMLGIKTFEVRKNDRDYQLFDLLTLEEWEPTTQKYSGRIIVRRIIYVLRGGQFGLPSELVVLGLATP